MIGLDTNVIVRYVVRDDPTQTAQADQIFSRLTTRNPGYLALPVLLELWWVLGRSYRHSAEDRCRLFQELLVTDELIIDEEDAVSEALRLVKDGADFADALIAGKSRVAGCSFVATFDQGANRHAGMTPVSEVLKQLGGL